MAAPGAAVRVTLSAALPIKAVTRSAALSMRTLFHGLTREGDADHWPITELSHHNPDGVSWYQSSIQVFVLLWIIIHNKVLI
jgi:hypothetical protein